MKAYHSVKSLFILISSVIAVSLLVSCGSSTSTTAPASGTGRVSLLITDGPTNDFDQINLTLESISFLCEDDDDSDDEDDDDEASTQDDDADTGDSSQDDDCKEVILFEETRVINLLALQNYSNLLSTTSVPAGTYSKIRLRVSQVELVKLNPDGTVFSSDIAKLPANGKIDLNPRGSFEITSGSSLVIELDIDAEKSIQIVETGNGVFIFRPVIFVNILGEKELKLVILDGKVLAKDETGFQLCKVEAVEVNDDCIAVVVSENTVLQDELIDVILLPEGLEDNDIVTVLGKASAEYINALHIVKASVDKSVQNQALFSGLATSSVDVDKTFDMKTDDGNDVVIQQTLLTVALAEGSRVFDVYGTEVSSDNIGNGSDVDVFGLAAPDLISVEKVKAAFVIYNNDTNSDKVSGTIAAINETDEEIILTVVNELFSGDVCVDVDDAKLFLLDIIGDNIGSEEITIGQLELGMSADVYSEDDDDESCLDAEVVLLTAPVVAN